MLRVGLIGCGGIVQRVHALGYKALAGRLQVAALADVSPANLEQAAGLFEVPPDQRYADYRDILSRAPIDAVAIATPHSLHVEQAIAAAEAGKIVISEKPMATSLAEADAILAAVRRAGVPYTVVHNCLFSAAVQGAARLLADGSLGPPILGHGELMGSKSEQTTKSHIDWRASRRFGGGCVIDTAYHEIYTVEALMGSPVRSVQAQVATLKFDIDVDDTALLTFVHANGKLSTVSASWCARAPALRGRWVVVNGTRGAVRVVHSADAPLSCFRDGTGKWEDIAASDLPGGEPAIPGDSTGHAAYFRAVVSALEAGAPLPVTGEQARHNLAIVEAARQASASGRAVEIA